MRGPSDRRIRTMRRLTAALSGGRRHFDDPFHHGGLVPRAEGGLDLPPKAERCFRFLTLNVAHGRRNGPHQAFVRRRALHRNLVRIANTLKDLTPDVIALQEADGPSAWSGNFDHVAALARMAELPDFYRGDHNPFGSRRLNFESGTALLARQRLIAPASHSFGTCWRDTKGFVVATVPVPEWGDVAVDVVSIHLDFLRPALRRRQIRAMVERLVGRPRPLVVLGDLNCSWRREPRSLELLSRTLGLRAYHPLSRQATYPAYRPRRRLDWILISSELRFSSYRTVASPLSDHLGVVADLELEERLYG